MNVSSEVIPLNALSPIVSIEAGIVNVVSAVHPLNASLPIEDNVELASNVTDVKLVQFSNAPAPIDVVVLGITICDILVPLNA